MVKRTHTYRSKRTGKFMGQQIGANADIKLEQIKIRGLARIAAEAQRTQERLDDIGCKALAQFSADARPQDVDEDWVERFVSHARMVGDPEMRTLWARILAGEVNKPGSYSRRTLSTLSDLTKGEAEIFTQLCGFCSICGTEHDLARPRFNSLIPRSRSKPPRKSDFRHAT